MSSVPQLVRVHCQQCRKAYHPAELIAGLCVGCLNARVNAYDKHFYADLARNRSTCFECKADILFAAYMSWDNTAQTFVLLCADCADKKWRRDGLYRGTPHAYRTKAQ